MGAVVVFGLPNLHLPHSHFGPACTPVSARKDSLGNVRNVVDGVCGMWLDAGMTTTAKINRQDLRRRLIAAEQLNRHLVDDNTRLDIEVAADEIMCGVINIAAAETDEGDDLDRLVMACILSEGRWWVEWESTGCTTDAELAGWVMDRAGDTCTEEQAYKVIDELSRLGFFRTDEDDKFLLRKMSDDEWFQVTADILATWEQVINRGAK